MTKTYTWTGTLSTDFETAGNWDDVTDNLAPSDAAPGIPDTAVFSGGRGTISGDGTVDTINFNYDVGADWIVTGTLDAIGGGITNEGLTLTLAAAGVLEATQYSQYAATPASSDVLDMLPGAQMTLTGAANSTYLPHAFNFGGLGTIDGATLDARGGGVNINGDLMAEDGAQVTALDTSIYVGNGETGTLTITGPDTNWHDVGSYDVVNGTTIDTGYMSVDGGTLIVSDDATLTEDGSGNIDGDGAATITGGAVWRIGTGLTGC